MRKTAQIEDVALATHKIKGLKAFVDFAHEFLCNCACFESIRRDSKYEISSCEVSRESNGSDVTSKHCENSARSSALKHQGEVLNLKSEIVALRSP